MKLSIQYLQKAIDGNQPSVKELSGNVARTPDRTNRPPVENLRRFSPSSWFNIENIKPERFNLHGGPSFAQRPLRIRRKC